MTDRELMQQALEALEEINKLSVGENAICLPAEIDTAMDALRERLAQPEQEPVAWRFRSGTWFNREVQWRYIDTLDGAEGLRGLQPLYTAPRQWQGLTDEERNNLWRKVVGWGDPSHDDEDLMKAIEAKLREKNA